MLLTPVLPVLGYLLSRSVSKLDPSNAAAVAAHYGSVSVVTFAAAMTVLSASASYIVVPAAMRTALPAANPALYLTLSLGITFPFNFAIGIPLYEAAARIVIADDDARVASAQSINSFVEER